MGAGCGERGFSLIETLVAIALLAGAMTTLVRLVSIAESANADARRATIVATLAVSKMEELRGPTADRSVDSGRSLDADVDQYCDFFDADGYPLGSGAVRPAGTAFVRRWAIGGLGADPETRVLQVAVLDARNANLTGSAGRAGGWAESIELTALRSERDR